MWKKWKILSYLTENIEQIVTPSNLGVQDTGNEMNPTRLPVYVRIALTIQQILLEPQIARSVRKNNRPVNKVDWDSRFVSKKYALSERSWSPWAGCGKEANSSLGTFSISKIITSESLDHIPYQIRHDVKCYSSYFNSLTISRDLEEKHNPSIWSIEILNIKFFLIGSKLCGQFHTDQIFKTVCEIDT